MSSGSYFPDPVMGVEIPKKSGGVRVLGIPTVIDRIAQMAVKIIFEKSVEEVFLNDSYGYRPNRSAHDALEVTRKRCWEKDWVLEFDIKGLFDNIDHDLLMKAVRKHATTKWEILYIERWLKAPISVGGKLVNRSKGVPQGGVISPVLSNLFLHYAFDLWFTKNFPNNSWCRYADDAIIHCVSQSQGNLIMDKLDTRLVNCGLELHPTKTKLVYCKDSNRKISAENVLFTFLGYTFKPRKACARNGKSFASFLPAISNDAKKSIRQTVKDWRLLWMTNKSLQDIANKYNAVIQGWLNYYGKYGRKELTSVLESINKHLCFWIRRKYKKYKRKPYKARSLLMKMIKLNTNLFAHWAVGIT